MNKVEELIEMFCPDGVIMKEIGAVAKILNGYAFKSGKYVESGIRVIRISDVQKGEISDNDLKFYPIEKTDEINNYLLKENDLVMSLTGNVGRVAMLSEEQLPAGLNQRVACVRTRNNEILTRFLFHFFDQNDFEKDAMTNATGGGQKNMSTTWLSKYRIPIPPLPVQQEIVTILDKFTQLEAELEAELEARRAQYEYYKNELLNFEESDKWTELKEIVDFSQGIQVDISKQSPVKKDGFVRFLRIVDFVKDNEPPRYIKNPGSRYVKNDGDLVMIRYGASAAGKVFLIYNGAIANNMFQIKLITKELDIKFLYYYLSQTKIYNFLNSNGGSSTMPAITFGQIGAVKIPIPSLAEQERIVGILDKFEALVNDISVGIPAEIKARRKQYEYYRGKLLDFKSISNG